MVSYTPNKYLTKPANGDDVDTWDVPINGDWDIIDAALGSAVSLSMSNTDITLTVAQARNQQIYISGALTANVHVIIPFQTGSSTAAVGGEWIVYNNTSGSYTVGIITQVSGSTGVTVPQGYNAKVYSNQTNIRFSDDARVFAGTGLTQTSGVISLNTPVAVSNGGTGQTSFSNGQLLIGNTGTGGLVPATLTAGSNITITNGAGSIQIDATTGGGGGGISSLTLNSAAGLTFNGASSATLTTSGTITINGLLGVPYGGTGNTSLTGYVKGSGSSALSAVTSIPATDITGTVANATNAVNATSATTATTATNLSGGTVNATTISASGAISGAGITSSSGFTATSGIYSFGSGTGMYGSAGSSVGWEVSGSTLASVSSTTFNLNSSIVGAYCYFGTAWTNLSDKRAKKNVRPFELGTSAVCALNPVSFQYNGANNTPDDGKTRIGLIAQEVLKTPLKSMVTQDDNGYYQVNTNDLIFALINAVRELNQRINDLEYDLTRNQ